MATRTAVLASNIEGYRDVVGDGAEGLLVPPRNARALAAGLERLLRRDCREVSSRYISYWEDVEPDGLFLAWLAVK